MIVNSNSSIEYYPDNKAFNFKVHLQNTLLLNGLLKVALCDILFDSLQPEPSKMLYIYSNICSESIVDGYYHPLLRRVKLTVYFRRSTLFVC